MPKLSILGRWHRILILSLILLFALPAFSQRTGYPSQEFVQRRQALMAKVGEGMIILFGEVLAPAGHHFRQDNDFFYFTGVEDPGAVLIMTPRTKESFLFLPRQTPREQMMEGANLLQDAKAAEKMGFKEIYDVTFFDEFIARNASRFDEILYIRLSPRDAVDSARWESQIFLARKSRLHYNDQISLDNYRIQKLQQRYPVCKFKDVVPLIDSLRVIKTPAEIEILRRNGRISAEAIKQAMLTSRPGVFEYEIEASAMHVILKNGARGAAYPPIVGSGANTCILHYEKNSRRVEEGDLILMDFGADLDYLCMDISRTWPASGKFTPEERQVYEIVLEVQKACLEAYRPGVTAADVEKHVAEVMKKKSLDARGQRGGIGHYVGLATHDVGPRGVPLEEGMVFAIEPGLYYPEKKIGVRIEDTVLITKDGCEVLTKEVPKEIDEVEKLLARRGH